MVNFEENYHFSRFQRGQGLFSGGDSERFAHFSAKYLIEIGLMGEISRSKM